MYSNQPEVTLRRDGEIVGTQTGKRIFTFDVPIDGEHELTATSGALSDRIVVRRVAALGAQRIGAFHATPEREDALESLFFLLRQG